MTGDPAGTMNVVVMGVSASGKSSVGRELAQRLSYSFIDADDLHPASNVAKMQAGVPLNDDDRWPWLDRVAEELGSPQPVVIACSALKRAYRDRLRRRDAGVAFVHLAGSEELLAGRSLGRQGHFMPPALLRSQLETLECLEHDEHGVELEVADAVEEIVNAASRWVSANER